MTISIDNLCTLDDLHTGLSLGSDTTEDNLLNQLIPQVSQLITESCNRQFFLASNPANPITSYLSGNASQWLTLPVWPVQSITAIYVDEYGYAGQNPNGFAADTELTAGQDYYLRIDQADGSSRSGMVARIGDTWQTQYNSQLGMLSWYEIGGFGNVKVTYVAGFNSIPGDLNLAAIRVCAKARLTATYGRALSSGGFEGDWNYSLADDKEARFGLLGGDVAPILARYRITAVAAGFA